MKKNLIALSIIALFIVACEKEELSPLSSTESNVEKQSTNEKLNRTHIWKEFTIHPETGEGVCYNSLSTCLDEVVINGLSATVVDDFTQLKAVLMGGNRSEIGAAFQENAILLQRYLDKVYVDGVIDGDMYTDFKKNELDGYIFIHFYNSNNQERILTLPLKF